MEPNYAFARSMAWKILKDYKLSEVPTDLSVLFKGLDLKYIGLNDIDDIDGAIIEWPTLFWFAERQLRWLL